MATAQEMPAMAMRVEAIVGEGEGGQKSVKEVAIGAASSGPLPEDVRNQAAQPMVAIAVWEVSEVATVTPATREVMEGTGECDSDEKRFVNWKF